MKKLFAIVLSSVLLLGLLSGCAGAHVHVCPTQPVSNQSAATQPAAETQEQTLAQGAVKTGLAVIADVADSTSAAADAEGAAPGAPATLVVTGGTVTTLVAVEKALVPYDPSQVHLATLSRETLERLEARLAALTVDERAALPGIQPKRAAVIVGGAVAVGELMRQTGFSELTVSESDLLFGLATVADAALRGAGSPVGWVPAMRPLR